jgi:hypothetical protein
MVLNSLRSYRQKYGAQYGELVIATDTGYSWRKGFFPYYKANRKKDRDESTLDWESIFEGLREIKHDLREYFPYRVIEVDGAEADDVIGVLVHKFGSDLPGSEQIIILSGDKDFKQLQTYLNVDHYDPVRKRSLSESDPEGYLIEHIIKGDKGDGIPNVLTADSALVLGVRQTTMTAKRLAAIKEMVRTQVWDNDETKRNYIRNKVLIDLKHTPPELALEIFDSYNTQAGKGRDNIFNYLMKNRMKHLMELINEF